MNFNLIVDRRVTGVEQKVSDVRITGNRALSTWTCLRNQQLVTVAVVLLSFLTYAAFRTTHADVASAGRRLEDNDSDGDSTRWNFSSEEGVFLEGIRGWRD